MVFMKELSEQEKKDVEDFIIEYIMAAENCSNLYNVYYDKTVRRFMLGSLIDRTEDNTEVEYICIFCDKTVKEKDLLNHILQHIRNDDWIPDHLKEYKKRRIINEGE